jgi:hypothetical protein
VRVLLRVASEGTMHYTLFLSILLLLELLQAGFLLPFLQAEILSLHSPPTHTLHTRALIAGR